MSRVLAFHNDDQKAADAVLLHNFASHEEALFVVTRFSLHFVANV